MALQFSPKTFFRLLPGPLLKDYFTARGHGNSLPSDLPESSAYIDHLYKWWEALPTEVRDQMEAELRGVHEIAASDTGLSTVFEEAEFHGRADELREAFSKLNTLHEKMLWTHLHQPRIFEVANIFEWTDNLSSRYWRKCTGLLKRAPKDNPAARNDLAAALREYHLRRED